MLHSNNGCELSNGGTSQPAHNADPMMMRAQKRSLQKPDDDIHSTSSTSYRSISALLSANQEGKDAAIHIHSSFLSQTD
jgi:hypothetical protein